MSEFSFAEGRRYARDHDLPPCSTWLEETCGFDACDRHHFLNGFEREKATWPFSQPADLRQRECRCAGKRTPESP